MTKRTVQHAASAGFTLIEILVVMVIIGVLATIGLGQFQSAQVKGRDAKRKSDLKNIGTALEVYYNDKRSYPLSDGNGGLVACSAGACDEGEEMSDGATIYMVQFPGDPSSNEYYYETDADGSYFRLYARLENELDRQSAQLSGSPAVYSGTDCGVGGECNYGISSSNQALPQPVAE